MGERGSHLGDRAAVQPCRACDHRRMWPCWAEFGSLVSACASSCSKSMSPAWILVLEGLFCLGEVG